MSRSLKHSLRVAAVIALLIAAPYLLISTAPADNPYASALSVASSGLALAAPSSCANTICGALGLHHCDKNKGSFCHRSAKDPTRCSTSLC